MKAGLDVQQSSWCVQVPVSNACMLVPCLKDQPACAPDGILCTTHHTCTCKPIATPCHACMLMLFRWLLMAHLIPACSVLQVLQHHPHCLSHCMCNIHLRHQKISSTLCQMNSQHHTNTIHQAATAVTRMSILMQLSSFGAAAQLVQTPQTPCRDL